jgi:hypothetical protein
MVFTFDYKYERSTNGAIANRWYVGMGNLF